MSDTAKPAYLSSEIMLKKLEDGSFEFKFSPELESVPLSKEKVQAAYDAATGTYKDILKFLIDATQDDVGTWHTGSAASLKPGQAVLE